jgi:hypothetical protein
MLLLDLSLSVAESLKTLIWPYASDQPSIKPLLTKLTYDNYKSIGQDIMELFGAVGSLNTPANSLIKTVISKSEDIVLGQAPIQWS